MDRLFWRPRRSKAKDVGPNSESAGSQKAASSQTAPNGADDSDLSQAIPTKDLWDQAYSALRQNQPRLLEAYERLLESTAKIPRSSSTEHPLKRANEMSALLGKKLDGIQKSQWKISIGAKSVSIREQVDKIVKVLLLAKDLMQPAVNIEPIHAGFPLMGICVLLQLAINDNAQHTQVLDGLEYVSSLIPRFAAVERTYFGDDEQLLREELTSTIVKIYMLTLEFEARAICQFSRNTATQIARNVIALDDWKGILERLKIENTSCEQIRQTIDGCNQHASALRMEDLLNQHRRQLEQMLREAHVKTVMSQDERQCHQTLRTTDYERHMARNPDRVAGTCQWFLQHHRFTHWRKSKVSSLLWASADPGCGKSVLSKYLIEHELPSSDSQATCYFFFKDDNTEQRGLASALSALLHQLFSQKSHLISHAEPEFFREGPKLSGLTNTLWRILIHAANDPRAGIIVCIIDALDECEESGRFELIERLNQYYSSSQQHGSKLSFLVTSRPYFDIERRFHALLCNMPTIHLAGEEETERISREIDLVIEAKVRQIGRDLSLQESTQLCLAEKLRAIPNRTYLWLHLTLERFNAPAYTKREVQRIIDNTPETVFEAFQGILERIRSEDVETARRLLQFVVTAKRPLTLRETQIALQIEERSRSYDDLDLVPLDVFQKRIRDMCGLFVNVIDSRLYLIHQTAREFLVSEDKPELDCGQTSAFAGRELPSWRHSFSFTRSNLDLARSCVNYLLSNTFQNMPLNVWPKELIQACTKAHGFLDYAATYWSSHVRKSHSFTDPELTESVLRLCDPQSGDFKTWSAARWWSECPDYDHYDVRYPDPSSHLESAAALGLEVAVRLLLGREADHKMMSENAREAFRAAAEKGHENIIELLLNHQTVQPDDQDRDGDYVLHIAASNQCPNVVMRLLQKGADPNIQDAEGRTPLSWAVDAESEDSVKHLLAFKADLNLAAKNGRTPVLYAVLYHNQSIIKLLLDNGANINIRSTDGFTPLFAAVRYGHVTIVKLLLEAGVILDLRAEYRGNNAISWAVKRGDTHVVKLLENAVRAQSATATHVKNAL